MAVVPSLLTYLLYRADIVWASEPEEKAPASPGGKESRKAFEPL